MHDRDPISDLFEDLEQQALALATGERDEEVAARAAGEYAAVTLRARLHASVGREVLAEVEGAGRLRGVVREVGADWWALEGDGRRWAVRTAAVLSLAGLSPLAVHADAQPATARLGFPAVLRRAVEDRTAVRLHLRDGRAVALRPVRVGADFVEAAAEESGWGPGGAVPGGALLVVPLSAVAAAETLR